MRVSIRRPIIGLFAARSKRWTEYFQGTHGWSLFAAESEAGGASFAYYHEEIYLSLIDLLVSHEAQNAIPNNQVPPTPGRRRGNTAAGWHAFSRLGARQGSRQRGAVRRTETKFGRICPGTGGKRLLRGLGCRSQGKYALRISRGRPNHNSFPTRPHDFNPKGRSGPSQVIDPGQFQWSDADWQGVSREGQVIYEMHFGTFTPEGTYAAAAEQLGELADLGVTVIEVMPLADFPGRFGWGYDGVCLFAPTRLYGSPDDLRRFIDQAHGHGLGVILDVVYNHLGPEGQTLELFSDYYFSDRVHNRLGQGVELRWAGVCRGTPVLSGQRGLLDRRIPFRRLEARRDARHSRLLGGAHPGGPRPASSCVGGKPRHVAGRGK